MSQTDPKRPWLATSLARAMAVAGLLLFAGWPVLPAKAEEARAEPEPLDALTLLQRLTSQKIDSVSKFAQNRLDAAAMVSMVERSHIQAHGYTTVADILRNVPGVYLTDDRSYSAVGLRGFNRPGDYNARMLMLVDGQRINDVIYDQALPGHEFPLVAEWVKRLEFISGPSSSVYGGNALFGVANLVTLSGADVKGAGLSLTRGSQGTVRAVAQYGTVLPDGGDVFVGVASYRTQGDSITLPSQTVKGLDDSRYLAVLAKYRDGGLQLQLAASERVKQVATAPYGTSLGQSGTHYIDGNAFARLTWDAPAAADWQQRWQFSLGRSSFEGQYQYEQVNLDQADAEWITGEYKATWQGWLNHTIVLGVEARHTLKSRQRNLDIDPVSIYLDDDHRTRAFGVYVQDEYRLAERWSLTSGLRLDTVDGRKTQASPRAALLYRPSASQAFKLLVGSAFRAPNLYERYYSDGGSSQVAHPDLGLEHITTVEVGMERALDEHTRLAASVYGWRLRDQIEFMDDRMRFENVAEATTRGAEIELEQVRPSGVAWRASLAVQDASSADQHLSNSPRWLAKVSASAPLTPGLTAGIELDAMGQRLTREAGTIGARTLANVNIRQQLAHRQTLSLRITNLGDVRYNDPVSSSLEPDRIAQPGRRLDLTWRVAF